MAKLHEEIPRLRLSSSWREVNEWSRVVARANQKPCLISLQGQVSNLEETDDKNTQDEGGWIIVSAQSRINLPLVLEVLFTSRYQALEKERDGGVNSGSKLERNNHVKMVLPKTQVRISTNKKNGEVLVNRDSTLERH